MYWQWVLPQVVIMYAMHGLFVMTAFDVSIVAAAVFPLWGMVSDPGGVGDWLGAVTTCAAARLIVPSALLLLVFGDLPSPGEATMRRRRLHLLRVVCHAFFVLACPLFCAGPPSTWRIPPGVLTLGPGGGAALLRQAAFGAPGSAMLFAAFAFALAISMVNGIGPFVGIQTAGSYAVLYSNLIVERAEQQDSNHYLLSPALLRLLGLPIAAMTDLVMVLEVRNAPTIERKLVFAPVAPFDVFSELVQQAGWERAGRCHWSEPVSPYIYTSVPGTRRALTEDDAPVVLPYAIPRFQLRVMISGIVASEPDQSFRVVYRSLGGTDREPRIFERRGGETLSGSDPGLTVAPSVYVRKLLKFRPLPVDLQY